MDHRDHQAELAQAAEAQVVDIQMEVETVEVTPTEVETAVVDTQTAVDNQEAKPELVLNHKVKDKLQFQSLSPSSC